MAVRFGRSTPGNPPGGERIKGTVGAALTAARWGNHKDRPHRICSNNPGMLMKTKGNDKKSRST